MSSYDQTLMSYAVRDDNSLGRQFPEDLPTTRTQFQRDRDRIIHSSAFRRLEYKTQVFVNHEGDWFRTRLTHSLEVAQISRTLARNLGLNEDLMEAIALSHDLGHTPFGHAGQDALHDCMRDFGGFEHNLQSLRVVDQLEERYAAFDGLNLMYETREGILKHCSRTNAEQLGQLGQRFITPQRPSLEAQVVNLADEIAYNNHDIDDGLRSGLINLQQLSHVEIWQSHRELVLQQYPLLTERRQIHETIRRMINTLVMDLLQQTRAHLHKHQPQTVDDIRRLPTVTMFSDSIQAQNQSLKKFLFANLYHHDKVEAMNHKAKRIVTRLFDLFVAHPELLPSKYQIPSKEKTFSQQMAQARQIADHIASMTDRFAIREYRRHFVVESI